jgi:hypothetical protein
VRSRLPAAGAAADHRRAASDCRRGKQPWRAAGSSIFFSDFSW